MMESLISSETVSSAMLMQLRCCRTSICIGSAVTAALQLYLHLQSHLQLCLLFALSPEP